VLDRSIRFRSLGYNGWSEHHHRFAGKLMSIFSRLFKGPEDGEKDPGASTEAEPGERAQKSPAQADASGRAAESQADAQSAPDSKASMRPMAPSFQINPPLSERSGGPIRATPVMQVSGPESKRGPTVAGNKPPPYAAPATDPQARTKNVGSGTVRLGSNASPPAPPASPQGHGRKSPSGAQRAAPPPPPAGGRPSPSAGPAARVSPNRTKAAEFAAGFDRPKSPLPPPARPIADEASMDGELTLELNSPSEPPMPAAKPVAMVEPTTAQGLAPAAQTAQAAVVAQRPAVDPGIFAPAPHDHAAFQNDLNDLDAAFGAIVEASNGAPKRPTPPPSGGAVSELRELFSALAANHMRQVREFMIGVKWGEAPRDWIPICEPAVASLLRAAKEMELGDLCSALEVYREALGRAAAAEGTTITGDAQQNLMAAYAGLSESMPEAFGLDGDRGRRETIIVHALLQQVPDVRKVTIDKIYAAGLTNLDNLFLARPDEISATTGIGENLASMIVEKFQHYRREIASLADATRAAEKNRLAELAAELRALHQEFERAASGWSDGDRAEKKRFRTARAEALLQVKVLLARLGEVDRLSQIERLPFERKIEALEQYLRESKSKEASGP
jgi:hypothetical protein